MEVEAQAKAAVIGWPVSHSLSPRLHGYWLAEHGIDARYAALPVEPERLSDTLKILPAMGLRGVNLTLPHKEIALACMDSLDAIASDIGAVNTVTFDAQGKAHGTNTDAYGFQAHIAPLLKAKARKAVVLGAGGASRAVIYALRQMGFTQIMVVNRSPKRLEQISLAFPFIEPVSWQSREAALEGAQLLVNTTSLGMKGEPPLELSLSGLPIVALVADIVYVPLETPLLQAARKRGHRVADGLGMLLHQAVPAFELWFGIRPTVTEALREHVLAGLQ